MRKETPINPTFLANMARLWRLDPRLAQAVDDIPLDAALSLEPSKAGPPTASVHRPDGRAMLVHSRYDPVREAEDFVQKLETSGDGVGCALLCGLGLGYHVHALRKRLGKQAVIYVAESDLVTIKTALETTDLSEELASGRLIFLTQLDKAHLHERLQSRLADLMFGILLAVPPASQTHQAEFHAACRAAVTDFAAFAKMSLVTLVRNAAVTCRNIADNLPAYVAAPAPDVLRRRFEGLPAVLVAAGPSLSRNVNQLGALKGRTVIIAAQTTLRPLLERGITPDFVTSLDFSDLSRQFFENVEIPDDVVLVAEPKAAWQAVDAFLGSTCAEAARRAVRDPQVEGHSHGLKAVALPSIPAGGGRVTPLRRVILLDNAFAEKCVGNELARHSPMEAGATVMHLAFYLAQWLGCDPIIFIGQDLGFTGHVYYAPGVAIHRAWRPETGRFVTLEMKEWERIARQRTILRRVKDASGRDMYTDEQMFTYLEQFERDFARSPARVIDATEGGARKAGAAMMTLREAADRHCTRPIPDACFDYLKRPWGVSGMPWYDASRLGVAREHVVARREELAAFRALCEETRALLKKLTGLLDDPARFNTLIVRVDELRTLVQRHELIFLMVRDASQLGELQKLAADRRLADDDKSERGRAKAQLERDLCFVESLLEGSTTLAGILDEAACRLDAAAVEFAARKQP